MQRTTFVMTAVDAEPLNEPPEVTTFVASPPRDREEAVRVYVSAASEDSRFVDALLKHIKPLSREGIVDLWRRGEASAGGSPAAPTRRLEDADLALLMVSPDFLAGEDTHAEMLQALDSHERTGMRVIPIIVRATSVEPAKLKSFLHLPRSGVPIDEISNSDVAYAAVVRNLLPIFEDLRAIRAATTPDRSSSDPLGTGYDAKRIRVGAAMEDIFVRNGFPEDTYVEPEQAQKIQTALRRMGRGLVIEGPTQIGKSTVVKKVLPAIPMRRIDCLLPAAPALIRAVLDAWSLEGHLVIDNVYKMSDDLLGEVATFMRWLVDEHPAKGKVTLIGVANTRRRLALCQPDLVGRFDEVKMNRQPIEKIRALVDQGQRAANLSFAHANEIATAARGSFRLAQELCFQCVSAEGPAFEEVMAGAARPVSRFPDDRRIRAEIRDTLGASFAVPVFKLARADRGTGGAGACLALLWLLAFAPEGRVSIQAAAEQYSHLAPAFMWIQKGNLEAWLRRPKNMDVASLVTVEGGEIAASDPRFLYYLGALDWKALGNRAGVQVVFSSESSNGVLQIVPETVEVGMAGANAPRELLSVKPPFPWWRAEAVRLRDLLEAAYPDSGATFLLAAKARVTTGTVRTNTGLDALWTDLLEAATKQSMLQNLIGEALKDRTIRGYWNPIRECVGLPPAESDQK